MSGSWLLGAPGKPEHELRNGIHLLRYFPPTVAAWNPARGSIHQKTAAAVLARQLPHVDAVHGHIPLTTLAAFDLSVIRFVPRIQSTPLQK